MAAERLHARDSKTNSNIYLEIFSSNVVHVASTSIRTRCLCIGSTESRYKQNKSSSSRERLLPLFRQPGVFKDRQHEMQANRAPLCCGMTAPFSWWDSTESLLLQGNTKLVYAWLTHLPSPLWPCWTFCSCTQGDFTEQCWSTSNCQYSP